MAMNRKFVGLPRHPLDFKHQKKVARKLDALLNGQMVDANGNAIGRILYADGNTIFQFSGSGVAGKCFKVISDGGDYYNCVTWDGKKAGSVMIKVAKAEGLRCTLPTATPAGGAWTARTERGSGYSFTYAAIPGITTDGVNVIEYSRTKTLTADGTSETAWIEPPLNMGDIITAIPMTFAGPATLAGVQWLALTDGRAWATDDVDA
jgi:hypothetical protein